MPHHDPDSNAAEGRHRRGAGALVVVGLLGTAVGAAAALLLSPWRGAEARLRLKERAKDVGSKVGAKAKEMAAKAKDALPCKAEEDEEEEKEND